jgi:hypothetical protein
MDNSSLDLHDCESVPFLQSKKETNPRAEWFANHDVFMKRQNRKMRWVFTAATHTATFLLALVFATLVWPVHDYFNASQGNTVRGCPTMWCEYKLLSPVAEA